MYLQEICANVSVYLVRKNHVFVYVSHIQNQTPSVSDKTNQLMVSLEFLIERYVSLPCLEARYIHFQGLVHVRINKIWNNCMYDIQKKQTHAFSCLCLC